MDIAERASFIYFERATGWVIEKHREDRGYDENSGTCDAHGYPDTTHVPRWVTTYSLVRSRTAVPEYDAADLLRAEHWNRIAGGDWSLTKFAEKSNPLPPRVIRLESLTAHEQEHLAGGKNPWLLPADY